MLKGPLAHGPEHDHGGGASESALQLPAWTAGDAWLAGGTWLFSEPQADLTV